MNDDFDNIRLFSKTFASNPAKVPNLNIPTLKLPVGNDIEVNTNDNNMTMED